jgi:hypothetical protein
MAKCVRNSIQEEDYETTQDDYESQRGFDDGALEYRQLRFDYHGKRFNRSATEPL